MKAKRLRRSLRRIVGPQSFLDDPASLAAYAYDSSVRTATPDFVLFPQTTEQVAQIVRRLHGEGVPYVARGAGTNLSGGSIAAEGGAVIALTRMKRIIGIDPENQWARVEPGLTNLELQEALGKHGYFFAPDPASQKLSTLGGNVAENSGGPHCLKYGVTTNHILGLKLVAPGGEIVDLGGETLDSSGCDLMGLFVGSEGTFGIVTEILCRIMPMPESTKTLLAIYGSTGEAGQTVSDIIAAGILPATLEMIDNMVIRAVEESLHAGYPTDAAAVLIIEIDGLKEGLDESVREIERLCRRNGVREVLIAKDEQEREQLWAGRRGAFGAIARLFPNYSVSDGTVPRAALPGVLRRVSEIGRKYDLEIGNVFHAGDGNLHPLVFFDSRDRAQAERVERAGKEILEACVAAGGTISGEHGVGLEKIGAMPMVFGDGEIELMRRIKSALDPLGLCNPGKVLPEPAPGSGRISEDVGAPYNAGVPPSDTFRGTPVHSPANPGELASFLRYLYQGRKSTTVLGARTLFPHLPSRIEPDAYVETTRLRSIVEHDDANLTATVWAGLSIGELQRKLLEAGQFLPLDAPEQATLGGMVASALSGPRRHLYGSTRDLVLGLRFVTADGQTLKAGGKTVKNVAGYDFGKLLIGSWGRLGVITEITFRLMPLPKACGARIATFDTPREAYAAAAAIIRARVNPAVVTLLNSRAASRLSDETAISTAPGCHVLVVGAEGVAPAVQRQLAEMERICRENSADLSERMTGGDYARLIAAIVRVCYPRRGPVPALSLCISVPCGEAVEVLERMTGMEAAYGVAALGTAHVAGGLVYSEFLPARVAGSTVVPDTIITALTGSFPRSNIVALGVAGLDAAANASFIAGNRAPSSWVEPIEKCFDPECLMNPGALPW